MPDKRATYLEQGPGRGFSLIELLIVVAISLIIAAIAIPNPPRAHIATNECSPAAWLPTVHTAEITYSSTYPTLGFLHPWLSWPTDRCISTRETPKSTLDKVNSERRLTNEDTLDRR